MIRKTTFEDIPAILELAVSSGLFPSDATSELEAILRSGLLGELGPDHVWVTLEEDGIQGIAYFAPERMTEGTWNLYMLAIHPDKQRRGHGASLVRHVETDLKSRGARILLIETSSLGSFDRTRSFYRALGYTEEARIREFYKAGDDKIVFRKSLQ